MTLLDDQQPTDVAEEQESAPVAARRRRLPQVKVAWRRLIAFVIAGLCLLLLTGWIFVDPIGHLWYQSRQDHLSAQAGSVTAPKTGEQVAVLQDVTIGLNVVVAQGDGPDQLRGGPGHAPQSPLPGHKGNSVVFGRKGGWGGSFAHLGKLETGSKIYVKTRSGQIFVYSVTSVTKAAAGDRDPFAPSSDFRLTLVTTSGGLFGGSHLIVTAISGPHGYLAAPTQATRSRPAGESKILNGEVGGFLLKAVAAAAIILVVRRRHRFRVALLVSVPVMLTALLSLCLALDLLFNPLG